jgi:hypothetical protein
VEIVLHLAQQLHLAVVLAVAVNRAAVMVALAAALGFKEDQLVLHQAVRAPPVKVLAVVLAYLTGQEGQVAGAVQVELAPQEQMLTTDCLELATVAQVFHSSVIFMLAVAVAAGVMVTAKE